MAAEIGRKRLRNVLGYRINVATNYLVSMAIKVVAQVLSRLRFTRAVTKLTAQKKLVDMTQPWYTTFQVIKGPLGGGKRRNGGGAGGTCFSGGTEGDQSSPKGCLGGGATVSN